MRVILSSFPFRTAVRDPAETARPPDAKQLTGSNGDKRVRTGDYRIIHEIQDAQLVVLVLAMGQRRDIYQH
ncbi:type II toxin-antitoxin system RelE/ParE family toxin [Paenarthrobacter sp. RAF54_2]|uniref:type II toxin-antitoxin system RelE family toxin n=1 Tax=Paenarthrobacter sp. RAF54_2 TaxID=3233061 RepID=UPI003F986934